VGDTMNRILTILKVPLDTLAYNQIEFILINILLLQYRASKY
jgi:hypothetical protein